MALKRITFDQTDFRTYVCLGDFLLISPNGRHQIELTYVGEPPHGDSYHSIKIDGDAFPGLAWGCHFSISRDSRYLAFSWMAQLIERKSMVIDLDDAHYFVLPDYVHNIRIAWPDIIDVSAKTVQPAFTFSGNEHWHSWRRPA